MEYKIALASSDKQSTEVSFFQRTSSSNSTVILFTMPSTVNLFSQTHCGPPNCSSLLGSAWHCKQYVMHFVKRKTLAVNSVGTEKLCFTRLGYYIYCYGVHYSHPISTSNY